MTSCRSAVSVGSPSIDDWPSAPIWTTPSLHNTTAPASRRWPVVHADKSSASRGATSRRSSATLMTVTVILFSVRVPVLSEQITVTEPSVSTAGNLRISALRRSMRCDPIANVKVTTAGSPSGMTATATLIAVRTRSDADSPPIVPISTTSAATATPTSASCLPTRSRRTCNGVSSTCTFCSSVAIRPNSVLIPVATTTPTPRPAATWVPLKARHRRSPSATLSPLMASVCLSTGSDSPVNAASSIRKLATSIRRRSAGTTVPASRPTTSPGTNSPAATSTSRPSRRTLTTGTDILRRAAIACSARYSWKKPSSVNKTTIAPIAPASRYLPNSSESTAAPMRISTITAEI